MGLYLQTTEISLWRGTEQRESAAPFSAFAKTEMHSTARCLRAAQRKPSIKSIKQPTSTEPPANNERYILLLQAKDAFWRALEERTSGAQTAAASNN